MGLYALSMTNRPSRSALGDVLFERKLTGSDQFSLFITVDAGVGRNPSPAGPVGQRCGGIQSHVKAR